MTRTAEMTTATATTTTAAFKQYKFDSILVTQPNTTPKPVYPPQLSFDKKSIYAGDNANWKLNFKDLKEVQQSTIERDVYDDNNDGYGGRNGGGRGGRGGYATTSETLVLSLVGRKILLKCTTRKGHSAKAAHHLDSFLQGLKSAHRKVKVKNDGKDPYAFEEKKHAAAGSRGRSRSSLGQARNKRSIQVTPAQQSLYLSPHKKRHSTSGAFTSPIRKRRTSSVDAAKKSSSKGYSHYDPAVEEEDVEVTGNVVLEPESPAARVLKLPPKSPRNATPTKLRRVDGMEENTKPMRALIVNQLNGISGGNIKLKKKVDERMFAELSEDEFDHDDDERKKKDEEGASQPEVAEEEKEEEEDGPPSAEEEEKASDAPKRRRLQKARGSRKENSNNDDNDDSDMEFDNASTEANLSSCKKKLRMTLDDDDDEDEDEDEDETKMNNEKEAPNNDETTKSPSKPEPAEEPPKPKESTADAALSPKKKVAAPPKKGSIASFFAPKSSAAAKSTTDKKKEAGRSSSPPRDTYGVAIFTPLKKTPAKKPSSPSTPPRRTDSSKATPVPRQTQRKTSRYFANVDINGVATKKKKKNGTQTTLKYSSSEEEENNDEDVLPDYQDDYNDGYYNDEIATHKGSNENEDTYRTTAQERYPDTIRNRRPGGVYGRGKMPQSRLARRQHLAFSKLKQEVARTPFQSPYKVSPSTTTRRGLDFDNYGSRGSSTADAALGSSSSKKTLWGKKDTLPALIPASEASTNKLASSPKPKIPSVPGVQNLGNTCYLSASLQSLFSIPNFIAKLNDSYESRPPSKKMPLTESLLEVAAAIGVLTKEQVKSINPEVAQSKNLTVSSTMAANPAGVKRQMDVLTDKFKGYEQRDAHEFLSDLVDFLHDELAAAAAQAPLSSASASGPVGGGVTAASPAATSADENKDPNEEKDGEKGGEGKDDSKSGASASTTTTPDDGVLPTDEYFRLNVRVCLKCDSCGYSRSKDELYRHLSVDVGEDTDLEKWTVERSLKQFFQPEKREIKCEKCDSGVTATQTMEIISCPKALLLHFKRFIVTQEVKSGPNSGDNAEGKENEGVAPPPPRMEMVLKKNKAKIPLEESLSINPFVSEKEESNPSGKYHLRSVVHHIGNTAFSGHYTTCAKRIVKQQQQQGNEKSDAATDTNTTTTTNEVAQRDNEEQWVFFDDRVGTKKSIDYVTGFERNQRNCYMALYEMN